MMFRPDAIAAMRAHAEACYPEESCGLALWGEYIERRNTHPDPRRHFRIDQDQDLMPRGRRRGSIQQGIQAVVHSHPLPAAAPYPSLPDQRQQLAWGIPWAIVPVDENGAAGAPFVWGDGAPIPPLLDRPYRWGVTDCYSVIRDFYRLEHGLHLPAVAREWGFWNKAGAVDLYLDRYQAAGFRRVAPSQADVDDTVLYKLREHHAIHHAAVIIRPGVLLHHSSAEPWAPERRSLREPLSKYQQYITHVLRPPQASTSSPL